MLKLLSIGLLLLVNTPVYALKKSKKKSDIEYVLQLALDEKSKKFAVVLKKLLAIQQDMFKQKHERIFDMGDLYVQVGALNDLCGEVEDLYRGKEVFGYDGDFCENDNAWFDLVRKIFMKQAKKLNFDLCFIEKVQQIAEIGFIRNSCVLNDLEDKTHDLSFGRFRALTAHVYPHIVVLCRIYSQEKQKNLFWWL